MNQFVDITLPPPPPASLRREDQHNTETVLPRNQLDYQYAEHHRPPKAPYVDRSDTTSTTLYNLRSSHAPLSMLEFHRIFEKIVQNYK